MRRCPYCFCPRSDVAPDDYNEHTKGYDPDVHDEIRKELEEAIADETRAIFLVHLQALRKQCLHMFVDSVHKWSDGVSLADSTSGVSIGTQLQTMVAEWEGHFDENATMLSPRGVAVNFEDEHDRLKEEMSHATVSLREKHIRKAVELGLVRAIESVDADRWILTVLLFSPSSVAIWGRRWCSCLLLALPTCGTVSQSARTAQCAAVWTSSTSC